MKIQQLHKNWYRVEYNHVSYYAMSFEKALRAALQEVFNNK